MALSSAWGSSDSIAGKKLSVAEWSGVEISCPGSQWSHHLWKCSSVERMRQPRVNNTFFTVTLSIQVLIFVGRKEQDRVVFNKIITRFISTHMTTR